MNPSTSICIRNAPANWTKGLVQGMFSQYGPIEEISTETGGTFILEFEDLEDAIAAVEDNKDKHQVSFFKSGNDEFGVTRVVVEESVEPEQSAEFLHCANANCTKQVVVEERLGYPLQASGHHEGVRNRSIYCSTECYNEGLDMQGRVDIYDKWLGSLGRSGTGLLKDRKKLEGLQVTLDCDGVRTVIHNRSQDE